MLLTHNTYPTSSSTQAEAAQLLQHYVTEPALDSFFDRHERVLSAVTTAVRKAIGEREREREKKREFQTRLREKERESENLWTVRSNP